MKQQIKELMTVIGKITISSPCIEKYGQLLTEVPFEVAKAAISDMNQLIQETVLLFREVDKVSLGRIKSKMLTDQFLCPGRFFKDSLKITQRYLDLSEAINWKFSSSPSEAVHFLVSRKNRCGDLKATPLGASLAEKAISEFSVTTKNFQDLRETSRKVILLWNYQPAIVKAILQTKRRALGLDRNPEAKRFT